MSLVMTYGALIFFSVVVYFDRNFYSLSVSLTLHTFGVFKRAFLSNSGHDCSIRLWNLETRTCVQEITSHRKKFDESIYDVAFHPRKAFIASAGADGLAKVFL